MTQLESNLNPANAQRFYLLYNDESQHASISSKNGITSTSNAYFLAFMCVFVKTKHSFQNRVRIEAQCVSKARIQTILIDPKLCCFGLSDKQKVATHANLTKIYSELAARAR